jgi:hypothetical protein
MRSFVLIFIVLIFPVNGNSQELTKSTEQLGFMIGAWKGNGWILGKDRTKKYFAQSEIIQKKGNGKALMVDGLGHEIDSSGTVTDRVIHNAFGVLSFNKERETVTMITFSEMNGRMESDILWLGDRKLQWSFDAGNGSIVRFTEDFSDANQWKEIGEISMNGMDWYQFSEMSLNKIK